VTPQHDNVVRKACGITFKKRVAGRDFYAQRQTHVESYMQYIHVYTHATVLFNAMLGRHDAISWHAAKLLPRKPTGTATC
jgi:hypothetical protein